MATPYRILSLLVVTKDTFLLHCEFCADIHIYRTNHPVFVYPLHINDPPIC